MEIPFTKSGVNRPTEQKKATNLRNVWVLQERFPSLPFAEEIRTRGLNGQTKVMAAITATLRRPT